jgi:hypothetical protein
MVAARHKPCCSEITAAGQRLASQLEAMDVESLWLAHQHVDWETGEANRGEGIRRTRPAHALQCLCGSSGEATGCCLLSPLEHSQQLLANAQAKWLGGSEAQERGWQEIVGA